MHVQQGNRKCSADDTISFKFQQTFLLEVIQGVFCKITWNVPFARVVKWQNIVLSQPPNGMVYYAQYKAQTVSVHCVLERIPIPFPIHSYDQQFCIIYCLSWIFSVRSNDTIYKLLTSRAALAVGTRTLLKMHPHKIPNGHTQTPSLIIPTMLQKHILCRCVFTVVYQSTPPAHHQCEHVSRVHSTSPWRSRCAATSPTHQRTTTTSPCRARPSPLRPESSSMSKRSESHAQTQHITGSNTSNHQCKCDPAIKWPSFKILLPTRSLTTSGGSAGRWRRMAWWASSPVRSTWKPFSSGGKCRRGKPPRP